MTKTFDMEAFLSGVLTGSHATRQRHVRQAKCIHQEILKRWQRANPWNWQKKHLVWFLDNHLGELSEATNYYYLLTARLITRRLGRSWVLRIGTNANRDWSSSDIPRSNGSDS